MAAWWVWVTVGTMLWDGILLIGLCRAASAADDWEEKAVATGARRERPPRPSPVVARL